MTTLPAVDAHAHVKTSVGRGDLEGLDALIFAVTREAGEWGAALARHDKMTLWGIGVHPRFDRELEAFSSFAFETALGDALLVGEVGLDSKTLGHLSQKVFAQVLGAVAAQPRPTSIHSYRASRQVLDALAADPIAAPILHWWKGDPAETEEAIAMGCFFSLNGAGAERPGVLGLIPPERVLTETDYPHSRKSDPAANRPAAVATIESALMSEWGLDEFELRRRIWRNVSSLFERCELLENLPEAVQEPLLIAGLD